MKMKERSITRRNLAGGFLGGILGIVFFGYIHPGMLPIGCACGVIGGWWYQEILRSALEGWHKEAMKTRQAWDNKICMPAKKIAMIRRKIKTGLDPFLVVIKELCSLVAWVVRSPVTFYRWLGKHQMNKVYVVRAFATAATMGLTALWVIPLGCWFGQQLEKGSMNELFLIPIFMLALAAIVVPIAHSAGRFENMNDFYSGWSFYSHRGPTLFFAKEVAIDILLQVFTVVFFFAITVWYICIGGAFLALVVAPLSFAIGMVKGIYRVAMRDEHWLCLATTLVVTLLFAWKLHPYFSDARILWAVALMSGVISALAAEGLRRLVALFYRRNEFAKKIAITRLSVQLAPSGRAFRRLNQAVVGVCLQPVGLE